MNKRMRRKASKTKLFLLEFIIIILFFSLAATVCVRIFVNAKMASAQSSRLTGAVLKAQEAAETFKAVDGDAGRLAEELNGSMDGQNVVVFYDKEWNQAKEQTDGVYRMEIRLEKEQNLITASILINHGQDEIYSLKIQKVTDA